MSAPKRMSLNTSLKDANIFADDDEETDYSNLTFEQLIKKERIESPPPTLPPIHEIDFKIENDFKIEPVADSSDGFGISSKVAEMALKTPVKIESNDDCNIGKTNLRSAKRTLMRQKNSPYSKGGESSTMQKRTPKKHALITMDDDEKIKRMRTRSRGVDDPEILKRRQKQIDFGKNTVGYDNYLKLVPKQNRTNEDPSTPDKHRIYSRRGFDGLIKKWRLQLHKYD